ncbi:GIY-YIG nuclease family protein [Roseivirga sp. E12]|uniref:GIY-YIG nuclease family protein n=1 Tax=Roseivirga sp. E12 TaxID=2819237 RepID=UPI001ABD221E|nr:GIY-YIG nuclease family protein [Roseivirga sp. E12]MBO3700855.1 GIY-YIG nuclease family protein [Roseivirga sp. E12]
MFLHSQLALASLTDYTHFNIYNKVGGIRIIANQMSINYTYILESSTSGRWYYGHSANVEERLLQHNAGQNKSTRNKGPWTLIFIRGFGNKLEANRFELYLKKLKNKSYIKREYAQYFL